MYQRHPLLVDEVGFCDSDNSSPDIQQPDNVQVFLRLRHHTFVRRHDEQHQADDAECHERQENEANALAKKHEKRIKRRMEPPDRVVEEQEEEHRNEESR